MPQGNFTDLKSRSTSIGDFSQVLAKVVSPASDEWVPLQKELQTDYLDLLNSARKDAVNRAEQVAERSITKCEDDLQFYVESVYPQIIYREEGLAAIPGAIGLASALLQYLQETAEAILKGATQEIVSSRKSQALKKFFSDEKNVDGLKADIDVVGAEIIAANDRERHLKVQKYVNEFHKLKTAYEKTLSPKALDSIGSCRAFANENQGEIYFDNDGKKVTGRQNARLSAAYQACMAELLAKLKKPIPAVVTAAANYDGEFDKAPDNSLAVLKQNIEKLKKVATAKLTPKAFIQIALRWVAILKTAKEKIKEEANSKKALQQFNGLLKALKKT